MRNNTNISKPLGWRVFANQWVDLLLLAPKELSADEQKRGLSLTSPDVRNRIVRAGLAAVVRRLFADSTERQHVGASARRVVDANRGSVARVLELVEPAL